MNVRKDIKVEGKHGLPVVLDCYYDKKEEKLPIVIFAHGFKGFKDWGHWHLVAEEFARKGFFFLKFNFSHNGTMPEDPLEFCNLEAFGQNNYSKEWSDIDVVLEWLGQSQSDFNYDLNQITLIGHSRGGGLSIVKAKADERIKKLITWASVSSLAYSFQDESIRKQWENDGVRYVMNGRTKQNMPLYYQLVEDYFEHEEKLEVEKAARALDMPWLIIHGSDDPAVPVEAAHLLASYRPSAKLRIIPDANHVFGGSHPYISDELPPHSRQLLDISTKFLSDGNI